MRSLFFLVLLAISTSLAVAQGRHADNQLPESYFSRLIQPAGQGQDDAARKEELTHLVSKYTFTSYQVKKLCERFSSDEARLAFAMAVFPKVTDKENFYMVYDAFGYFSSVMRLYDFVNGHNQPEAPQVVFPDRNTYAGPHNCSPVMNGEDFQILYDRMKELKDDQVRMSFAVSVVRNNCVAVSDVMHLALLLNSESLRLDLVRQSYPGLFDLNNLGMASQLFSNQSVEESFRKFVEESRPQHGFDPLPPDQHQHGCSVSSDEFRTMMESVEKQSFNNTRLSLAKQILSDGKCFTVDQVSAMINAFSFESSRLELAKYAYDFCSEKEKYYRVADVLGFEASKTELLSFLKDK